MCFFHLLLHRFANGDVHTGEFFEGQPDEKQKVHFVQCLREIGERVHLMVGVLLLLL